MWNHRVVVRKVGTEHHYGVHEVYYDSDENPTACTENSVSPFGETLEELVKDLQRFSQALEKPVLDYDSIGHESEE